ncbi:hypothetical protein [Microbacterium hydrocarbonoxydans]|uniref:hypothetical protein n=1 Tax=Microbacterium hydrocarbonoxydans TaxID=273678 RepID=UPI003D9938D5
MAGKDINIPITGDARDFVKETKNVEDALDDVADTLDDVTRDTKRGADQAERAIDDLADTFRDAQKRAKDLGDAGDRAGDDVRKGMKRAEDGVEEFKDEANSTAREAAASFDGSAESIGDALQEVAANAFGGFGPAGAVAGIAAAAGIGLAVAGFEQVQEAQEESEARAAEWAQAFAEAGAKIVTSATSTAKALDIITDPEQFKKAEENAKDWGTSTAVAIAAMSGETWALEAAQEALTERTDKVNAALETTQVNADGSTNNYADLWAEVSRGKDSLTLLNGELESGGKKFDAYSEFLRLTAEHTAGAIKVTDEFGDTVATLPDGTTIYIDAETGQATTDVNNIEKKIYGIPDGSASVSVDTSGAQNSLDRWIVKNSGRTIQIGTRTVDSGFGQGRG